MKVTITSYATTATAEEAEKATDEYCCQLTVNNKVESCTGSGCMLKDAVDKAASRASSAEKSGESTSVTASFSINGKSSIGVNSWNSGGVASYSYQEAKIEKPDDYKGDATGVKVCKTVTTEEYHPDSGTTKNTTKEATTMSWGDSIDTKDAGPRHETLSFTNQQWADAGWKCDTEGIFDKHACDQWGAYNDEYTHFNHWKLISISIQILGYTFT